jgi:putative DNA primase/helicase
VPSSYFDQEVGKLLAVQNGVLRLADRVLLPFDAAYKLRRTLAVPFNADARCPQFLEVLLRQALTEDDIELLQRWFGLVILGQNRAQVILLLIGTAGGGKGTIVRILKLLLGPSNVVSLRIRQLEGRFELGRMLSRSLAYGADVPADFLNTPGANVLKAITGGDPIAVELKGSNARPEMQLSLNVLITANVRLRARLEGGEDTAAWRRRLRIIQFNNPPPPFPIHDLAERLFREEGPGILNWGLDGLAKLQADGFNLWPNAQQQRIVDDLLTESDSVYHFVQDCLRPGDTLKTLTVTDAHGEYTQYCAARGWNGISRNEFGGKLPPLVSQCLRVAVRNDIVGMNGRQQQGFRGVVCYRPRHTET